jgi:hypothetical protein
LTSDEYDGEKTKHLDHREAKICDDFIGLSEREGGECEREDDEKNTEKKDEIEHLISGKLSEGIFGDVPHRLMKNEELRMKNGFVDNCMIL